MICLSCNAFIENGNYKCRKCNTVFDEDDVLVMLNNEKRRVRSVNARRMAAALVVLLLLASLLSTIFYFSAKKAKDATLVAAQNYDKAAKNYLDAMTDIIKYEYDEETVLVMVESEVWNRLTSTGQEDFAVILQQNITKIRYESGLLKSGYVTVQVVNEEDELLIYADINGEFVRE